MEASYGQVIPTGGSPNEWRLRVRDTSYVAVQSILYEHPQSVRNVNIGVDPAIPVFQGQTISLETFDITSDDFEGYTITLTLENL